jgi:hypothetical protein
MSNQDKYIYDISRFIWEKVVEYYENSHNNQYNQNNNLIGSLESSQILSKYEAIKNNYNNLQEDSNNKIKELMDKNREIDNCLANERMQNKLFNSELNSYKSQLAMTLERLKTINDDHNKIVQTLKTEYKEQLEYMKIKIEEANKERKQLLELFNEQLDYQVSQQVETYKKKNEELKRENEYYYNLYVDKSKGKFYETELYPRLLDYNTKHMGGQWNIEHVGSNTSEKCDFVFKHKDNGVSILMDTKNNIQSQPVNNVDMDKFLRDVSLDDNKAIGGILLANSRICNKKEFEVNEHQGRSLVFISNFNQDNIGFIFSILDFIYSKYKEDQKEFDVNKVKHGTFNDITFLKERTNVIINEKRKLEGYISSLENRFIELYGHNIDEWATSKNTKIDQNKTNNKEIIDFEEIEKGRTVIGKRTKYYLCYDDPNSGEHKIQYFQNNSRKEQRLYKMNNKDV